MLSFEYNGQSTDKILGTPLIVVTFDTPNDINGFTREIVKGEKTLLRQEANHYGAMYSDESTYDFYLVKQDGSGITNAEQRKINKWLTSPTLPQRLTGIADDKTTVVYKGIFQDVGWKLITCKLGKLDGVKCSFVSDTPFVWKNFKQSYNVSGSQSINLTVDSDDSEYIIYPKITISSSGSQGITITNKTTNQSMSVKSNSGLSVCLDCRYCMVTDNTVSGVIDYEDIGWTDAESITWLSLVDGANVITVSGSCTLTFEYDVPIKRVGDLI